MVRADAALATRWPARTALAFGGGYVFASGATAMLAILLVCFGIPRAQVAEAASLCGIPAYVGAVLWAYADYALIPVAAVLLGGGLVLRLIAGLLGYII